MGKIYGAMALVSTIVRQFILPNPFNSLGADALIANWIAEPFLHIVTFGIVGIYYQRRSNPVWGSLLYLMFYLVHTWLIFLAGLFGFSKVAIIIIAMLYIALHIVINIIRFRTPMGDAR